MDNEVIVGISGGHNAGITVYNKGQYIVIDLERLFNHKNISWSTFQVTMDGRLMTKLIKHYLKVEYDIEKIDLIRSINSDYNGEQIGKLFDTKLIEHNQMRFTNEGIDIESCGDTGMSSGNGWCAYHHKSHASGTFYQSPFEEAIVFSFDGGGDDGWNLGYKFDRKKEKSKQIETIHFSYKDYGNPYFYLGYFIDDIKYIHDYGSACLTYSGKLMGYCSYGKIINDWVEPLKEYYLKWERIGWNTTENDAHIYMKELGDKIGLNFYYDKFNNPSIEKRLSGDDAYNLAATSQYVFEELHFDEIKKYIDEYKTNVCLTGGCAMNILYNTKIKNYVKEKKYGDVFIAPNSSDCGLATGLVLDHIRPNKPVDLTYAGENIYDEKNIYNYLLFKNFEEINLKTLIEDISECKIFGLIQGGSEHGPRALGNRSIICLPRKGMKDILNMNVKHREFFRPFAPVVRLKDVSKYFEWEGESRHMSFAAKVKEKYREDLDSITHVDGTARIQTITKDQNKLLYEILTEMENQNLIPVLLNTSFNVAGKPILNTFADAFKILNEEQMDGLIIKNKYLPYTITVKK